jgi:hypothetical protein
LVNVHGWREHFNLILLPSSLVVSLPLTGKGGMMVSHCARPTSLHGVSSSQHTRFPQLPDFLSLRASDEHCFIVRVLRARKKVWRLPSHCSEAARCASTYILLYSFLACCSFPYKGRPGLALNCARRTTTALLWGFREHRGPSRSPLSISFAAGPSAKPAPVPTEAALPRSPVFTLLNPPEGMP